MISLFEKLINTITTILERYLFNYFLKPFLFLLVIFLVVALIKLLAKKSFNKTNFTKELFSKKNLTCFFFGVYICINFNATIFSRFSIPKMDPLSNIWGGWIIIENEYFFDFSVIWNILMFLPLYTFLYLFFKNVGIKDISKSKLFILSTVFSFLNSLLIEVLQIIFRVGTFQFSDLFYNTLGGALGIFLFIIIQKLWNKHLKTPIISVINKIKEKVGLN